MTKNTETKTRTPATVSGSVQDIPLCKLKKSPRNARKMPHPKADIEALAASIAANGMLQAPVVEPEVSEEGQPTGFYLVTIGEGRRQAQLLRVKRGEITKGERIRCVVDTEHYALEISLAENAIRSAMHPADQFDAFHELHQHHGLYAEDIAARFGVTPAVVKQRLKLATVSPVLMQAYRDGQLNLDQLTGYAFTDDHAKQERIWEELGPDAEREEILEALNLESIAAADGLAVFVGLEAYQQAGGAIARDLFDEAHQGFLTDPDLLLNLARAKLETLAGSVKGEGWKWVETMLRHDHGTTAEMRRIFPKSPQLSGEVAAQVAELEAEYDALDHDGRDDNAAIRIEQNIAELRGPDAFDPEEVSRAGVIISIGHRGEARIERGFIRREDDIRHPAKSSAPKNGTGLSDKLVAELTAHRTMALRYALGQQPDTALVATVHALAGSLFYWNGASCLDIRSDSESLASHDPQIEESAAGLAVTARHEGWQKRLPDEPEQLWDALLAMQQPELLALLAHCVAETVDPVKRQGTDILRAAHADALAHAVQLDMRANWQPTVANYLGRVSKERILEAVREGVSKEAAENLSSLKKQAMAELAAQRLQGRGWLPSVLRNDAVKEAA